jgi:hypothetical protein
VENGIGCIVDAVDESMTLPRSQDPVIPHVDVPMQVMQLETGRMCHSIIDWKVEY